MNPETETDKAVFGNLKSKSEKRNFLRTDVPAFDSPLSVEERLLALEPVIEGSGYPRTEAGFPEPQFPVVEPIVTTTTTNFEG